MIVGSAFLKKNYLGTALVYLGVRPSLLECREGGAIERRKSGSVNEVLINLHKKKLVEEIMHLNKDFFSGILNISSKTLDRYRKAEKRLTPSASQLMLKLFTLYRKGEEIFGNLEEFQKWIEEPAYGLGSKIPKTLFQTPAGIDLIMDELVRIEYGDLA